MSHIGPVPTLRRLSVLSEDALSIRRYQPTATGGSQKFHAGTRAEVGIETCEELGERCMGGHFV